MIHKITKSDIFSTKMTVQQNSQFAQTYANVCTKAKGNKKDNFDYKKNMREERAIPR